MPEANTLYLGVAAQGLAVGQSVRAICQDCGSPERSLSLTRTDVNEAKYLCFRNSCGSHGTLRLTGPSVPGDAPAAKAANDGYAGPLSRISDIHGSALQDRYHLPKDVILRNILDAGYPWLALPIRDANRQRTALQLRWSWLAPNPPVPKTKLYLDGERRTLAWYPNRVFWQPEDGVLLVEDCLSAMRAAEYGHQLAAALLGTKLTANHIQELHAAGVGDVVLALDPDAIDTAFEIAKAWGPAFRSFRVLAIEKDIKDLPLQTLRQLLAGI